MKNAKVRMLEPQIAVQNAETPRNPNSTGPKIRGSEKNINMTGKNMGGERKKSPNTTGNICED